MNEEAGGSGPQGLDNQAAEVFGAPVIWMPGAWDIEFQDDAG